MRLGLYSTPGDEGRQAELAEQHGLFGITVVGRRPGAEMIAAGEAIALSTHLRVIVRVPLGHEHPVTLAEDLAVLDNASGGRIAALIDTASLDAAEAAEDVQLLRRCLSARPVRHEGPRWRVPASLEGHAAPDAVEVTPKPVQLEVPVWLCGSTDAEAAQAVGAPVLAEQLDACSASTAVQPAVTSLEGDLEADRRRVAQWAQAGATHLLLRLPEGAAMEAQLAQVSRFLAPEVAMPQFPRVIAESKTPATWTPSA